MENEDKKEEESGESCVREENILEQGIEIRKSTVQELDLLAEFACRMNVILEQMSLFCPNKLPDIRRDLEENRESGALAAAWNQEEVVGLASCYVDAEKHNADCTIFVAPEYEFDEIAERLLYEAQSQIAGKVHATFFFPKENARCRGFLEKIGAKRQGNEYELLLQKEKMPVVENTEDVQMLLPEDYEAFVKLHDTIFPDCYITGKEILADVGQKHIVFVKKEEDRLLAYSVLRRNGGKRATAELIAVREGYRHQGYGRKVLSYLLSRAFGNDGMQSVDLIVEAENENALKLYRKMGFEVEYENCVYQYFAKENKDMNQTRA